jgi:hypothetical protein
VPNIRSQTVYNDGGPQALEIVASDGRTFTLTKAAVQAFYQSTSGNAASRRAQVIQWCKESIVAALGPEQIAIADLDYDFDLATGVITTARIGLP